MKKLALLLAAVFAVTGLAKEDKGRGNPGRVHGASSAKDDHDDDDDGQKSRGSAEQTGWKNRQVTREDKRGIEAYYREADAAMKRNDWQAMARQIDFPVMMVTDDSRGEGSASMWSREQWLRTMEDAMAGLPQNARFSAKRKPFFISNDLAIVEIENRLQIGNQKMNYRSADLLIRRNGQWVTKASIEGGWGEAMPSAARPQQPSTGGPGVPSGDPKGAATAPSGSGTTQQGPTAPSVDPKGTSGNPGDPKGALVPTSPTGAGKGATQPAPDAGTPSKGSRKDATTRPYGK